MIKIRGALAASALMLFPSIGQAIEGGTQTYLLGIRDSLAGIVPPPGVYFNNDLVIYSGDVPELVIGGVGIVNPDLSVALWRPNVTYVFDTTLWGGTPGFNISLPVVKASMDAQGVAGGFTGGFTDKITGFGDLSITSLLGWKNGNLYTSASLTFYLPTGKYAPATVDIPGKSASVLNLGKNRFAFDPTISLTYLDPANGMEFSGALGVTISNENSATQYQTAPEFHFEGAVIQHLPSGWAFGVTGYAFKQFSEDSGAGAASIKSSLALVSLKAEAYGLGPIVTYSRKIGDQSVSFKLKYIKEFGVKRAFEVDKLWLTIGLVF